MTEMLLGPTIAWLSELGTVQRAWLARIAKLPENLGFSVYEDGTLSTRLYLSPEVAVYWKKYLCPDQRELIDAHWKTLSWLMQNNLWVPKAQPSIIWDRHGGMFDGNHTTTAVADSGVGVMVTVIIGVTDAEADCTDHGIRLRSTHRAGVMSRKKGETNQLLNADSDLHSCVKRIHALHRALRPKDYPPETLSPVVLRVAQEYNEALQLFSGLMHLYKGKRGLTAGVWGTLLFACKANPKVVKGLVIRLLEDSNLRPGDPAHALKRYREVSLERRGVPSQTEDVRATLRVVQAELLKKELREVDGKATVKKGKKLPLKDEPALRFIGERLKLTTARVIRLKPKRKSTEVQWSRERRVQE